MSRGASDKAVVRRVFGGMDQDGVAKPRESVYRWCRRGVLGCAPEGEPSVWMNMGLNNPHSLQSLSFEALTVEAGG